MGKVHALVHTWAQRLIDDLLSLGKGLALTGPKKAKRLVMLLSGGINSCTDDTLRITPNQRQQLVDINCVLYCTVAVLPAAVVSVLAAAVFCSTTQEGKSCAKAAKLACDTSAVNPVILSAMMILWLVDSLRAR